MTIWSELTPTPFKIDFVDAAGISTRSLRAGHGQAVVFLHGTSGHLEAFTRNVSAHADDYAVHAIDMLGHGYTGKPNHPYEIPHYVRHLIDYLDAVGVDRAHIVGESLGGWVGARTAVDHPQRVASLQLLCAGGTVADPEVMRRIDTSTRAAVAADDIGMTRKRLQLLMASPTDATEELVQVRHRIYHQPDFAANIDNLLALQQMEVRLRNLLTTQQMNAITAPTLIVWGRQNPFGQIPEASRMHEAISGSRLEVLDDCGHWPQHEHAGRYNALSIEFLAKSAATGSAAGA